MLAKACFKCKEIKPLTDFYVHPAMGDGRLNKCKECAKADARANYLANIDRYQDYERGRASLPHRVEARKEYAKSPGGRQAGNRSKRAYLDRNPVKRAAHVATGNAIRDGRLVRQPCERCGAWAQAHHDDYSKPLDVRWLCTTHHAEWHRHNTPKCPDQEQAA
jgi:hypothetical protein